MSCFPCFSSQRNKKSTSKKDLATADDDIAQRTSPEEKQQKLDDANQTVKGNTAAKIFNFRELATATKNFRQECLLGEGGFGRVYKGTLQSTSQVVAVKQLDRHGLHDNKEFMAEVLNLSQLRHPNLVNLIGYCADGDQRLLVYEYISEGSVEDHLLDIKPDKKPLDWITRMKIAYGAAQGIEYLHETADPPVIYRDLKASNILLDAEFNPKLSDFGLYKLGPGTGDKMPLSCGVMGTYGYCAPEYAQGGKFTSQSDVYSFGVVLLELITGRRAVDTTKPVDEQNLVAWAQPIFRDPKRFPDMADPLLKRKFTERGLNQAVGIAAMCLQEEPAARPLISDVMTALSFLSLSTNEAMPTAIPILSFRDKSMSTGSHANSRATFVKTDTYNHRDEDEKEMRDTAKQDQDERSGTDSDNGSDSDSRSEQEDQETLDLKKSKKSDFGSSFGSHRGTDGINVSSLSKKDSKKSGDGSVSPSRYGSGRDDSLRLMSFRSSSQMLKDDENGGSGNSISSKSGDDESDDEENERSDDDEKDGSEDDQNDESISSDHSSDETGSSHSRKSEKRIETVALHRESSRKSTDGIIEQHDDDSS